MTEPAVVAVVNPKAANGRTAGYAKRLEKFLTSHGLDVAAQHTEGPGDVTRLAGEALEAGAGVVLAVGGDGTVNEVVNGFLHASAGAREAAQLAIAPIGTGTDFARVLSQSGEPTEVLARLRGGRRMVIDVGRVEYTDLGGGPGSRFFVNIAEFGSGGAVVEKVNRTTKVFGGRISFLLGILSTMPKYQNKRVQYSVDEGPNVELTVNNFIVANGRYFGGGLLPAPNALLDDGLFDVIVIGDISWKTIRRHLKDLRRGTHLSMKGVVSYRARQVTTTSRDRALLDLDGELVGYDPTHFACVPGALNLLV